MDELEAKKELKGIGGWLVLFQIYFFMTLVQVVQSVVAFIIMGSLIREGLYSNFYNYFPINIFEFIFSPYMYAYMAVIFVLTLLIVIFFYRKKIVFRTLFIIQSVVSVIGFIIYFVFIMGQMSTVFFDSFVKMGRAIMILAGVMSFIPAVGIPLALTIALFKSERVKNTFS